MSVSGSIRTFRKKIGMTQIDLAKAVEVSIATLRRWETGETAPTGTQIVKLAEVLNVAPEDIVASMSDSQSQNNFRKNNGMLVFEKDGTRIEIPPTEKGYEIFSKIIENAMKLKPSDADQQQVPVIQ